jgi:hypothetical protein
MGDISYILVLKKNLRLIPGILLPNYYPYIRCPQATVFRVKRREKFSMQFGFVSWHSK